ncbi:ribonuclease E inhibitor RraB [Sulfurovum sp.]|uniref:ribonuclease E inhibitor RraB n=1 Tax=Sulfurovum sp. TaxID=1969726 RepID=UPI003564CABB
MKITLTIFAFISLFSISAQNYACCINVDKLKIEELESKNIDVSKAYTIRFYMSLNSSSDALKASQDAQSIGYTEEKLYEYGRDDYSLWLTKRMVPNLENLMKVYNELYRITIKYNGIYNDADWHILDKS